MLLRRATVVLAALQLSFASGCHRPPAELVELCRRLSEARCARLIACCEDSASADCAETQFNACLDGGKAEAAELEAGTLRLISERLDICERAILAGIKTCRAPSSASEQHACAALLVDPAGAGEPCRPAHERIPCADGDGVCLETAGGSLMCRALAGEGVSCAERPCAPGLVCQPPATDGFPPTCGPPREAGGLCWSPASCLLGLTCGPDGLCVPGGDEGEPCSAPDGCAEELACALDERRCVLQVGKGEACLGHDHCQDDLRCAGKTLAGLCGERAEAFEPCLASEECADGLRCDAQTETCLAAGVEGMSCQFAEDCGPSYGCDPTDWSCLTLPVSGEPCLMGFRQCATPLTCFDFAKGEGLCGPRVGAGAECVTDNNCLDGFGCLDGRCTAAPGPGEACLSGYLCSDGWCDVPSGVCRPFRAAGEACPGGHECAPGLACVNQDNGALICVTIPTEGERCLMACAGGLVCRREVVPGTCVLEVCQ